MSNCYHFSKLFFLQVCIFFTIHSHGQININDLYSERVESDDSIIWQMVSPGNGGMSNTLRYHPTIPGHVTFMGDMWCSYLSTNNGKKWTSITDHDGNGNFERQRDLIYATDDPDFGISICGSLMFKSEDTGKSWQPVKNCPWYEPQDDGLDRSSWHSKVGGLGIDPSDKNIWFVGGGKFVRGDVSFSCFKNPTLAQPFETNVRNKGKLWRTKNGGQSWIDVGSDINAEAQIGPIKIHPKNSNIIFAATTHGVYKSTNGGDNWINISAGKIDNNIIMDLDYYYDSASETFILYIIDQVQYVADGQTTKCTGGIFQSKDEGLTWSNSNGNIYLDLNRLKGSVPNYYYRYIAKWFGITEAQAKNMYPKLPTKALQPMDQLTSDPTREGALYVGLPSTHTNNSIIPGRLWTTNDGGINWTNTARLNTHVWEIDKDYWEERGNPWKQNMEIGIESHHVQWGDNYALRGTRGLDVGVDGSVMMLSEHTTSLSKDYGKTWEQADSDFTSSGAFLGRGNSDLPAHVIAQDKRLPQTYLGSGEHRLWITTDDSPDERQAVKNIMNSVETISTIAFDPYNENIVYTTSSRQAEKQYIYRSDDAGENWDRHGVATPGTDTWADDFYTNALTIDPIDNNYMYHGITQIGKKERANEGGFFRSTDGGKTFRQSNDGLPSPCRIIDIQFDPRDITRASLFAAAEKYSFNYHSPLTEGGLYHSKDRGLHWKKINTPTSVEGIRKIRIDPTNRMYITTGFRGGGNGVWYTDDFGENWTQVFSYPRVEHIDISPFDHNLIAITLRYLSKNPGVYISRDRGKTWNKSNTNIVIPQHIEDLKFDIHDASKIWIGTIGTGFYKGTINDGKKIQVVKLSETKITSNTQLRAEIINDAYTNETISWHSENPSVATVDQYGNVKQISKGTTKIWASVAEGRFTDYSIAVFKNMPDKNDNFTIKTIDVSCPGEQNGRLSITSKSNQKFDIRILGTAHEQTISFTETVSIENLNSGVYELIITQPETIDFKQKFIINIGDGSPLIVNAIMLNDNKSIKLELSGSDLYNIYFNDTQLQSTTNEITLELVQGKNKLEVKTEKECQGVFYKEVNLTNTFTIEPIPSSELLYLTTTLPVKKKVQISIYQLSGQLILQKNTLLIDKTSIDISNIEPGIYILKVNGPNFDETKKIIIN